MYLKERLDNFLNEENKKHTFLLEGEWGVGKTYLIDEYLKDYINNRKYKIIQLSLFGLNSVSDLNEKLIQKAKISQKILKKLKKSNPVLSFKINEIGNVSINAAGLFEFLINEEYKNSNKKILNIIVIDDIERKDTKISIIELFGFIDSLKKNNTKIILISNTNEIKNNRDINDFDDFNKFKEKVIDEEYKITEPSKDIKIKILNNPKLIKLCDNYIFYSITNLRTINKFRDIVNEYEIEINNDNKELLNSLLIGLDLIDNDKLSKKEWDEMNKKENKTFNLNLGEKDFGQFDEMHFFIEKMGYLFDYKNVVEKSIEQNIKSLYIILKEKKYELIKEINFKKKMNSLPDFRIIKDLENYEFTLYPTEKYIMLLNKIYDAIESNEFNTLSLMDSFLTVYNRFKIHNDYKSQELINKINNFILNALSYEIGYCGYEYTKEYNNLKKYLKTFEYSELLCKKIIEQYIKKSNDLLDNNVDELINIYNNVNNNIKFININYSLNKLDNYFNEKINEYYIILNEEKELSDILLNNIKLFIIFIMNNKDVFIASNKNLNAKTKFSINLATRRLKIMISC